MAIRSVAPVGGNRKCVRIEDPGLTFDTARLCRYATQKNRATGWPGSLLFFALYGSSTLLVIFIYYMESEIISDGNLYLIVALLLLVFTRCMGICAAPTITGVQAF